MKGITRDFTITVQVPDHVEPEDCEIIVDHFSASYEDTHTGKSVTVEEDNMNLRAESPYEE